MSLGMHRFSARTIAIASRRAVAAAAVASIGFSTTSWAAKGKRSEPEYAYTPAPSPLRTAKKESETVSAADLTLPKPSVLFVLGGPGAGKGTVCTKLVNEYGYVHLSAGDLLREERDSGSPDGELIESCIREGKIVPVEVTVRLLKKAMEKSGKSKFLVDGFPRNFDNLEGWHRVIGDAAVVNGVLMYECPEEVMEKRLLERGKTSGRSDDNLEVIRKRFRTYLELTVPVIEHYEAQGKVFRINGNQPPQKVLEDTRKAIEPLIVAEVLHHNDTLLKAVHAGRWDLYESLSDKSLTCIEAESNHEVVKGLDFHKYYFDQAAAKRAASGSTSQSVLSGVEAKLLCGKAAIVAGNRLVQRAGRTDQFGETRVWQLQDGHWKQVHFHRSAAGSSDASADAKQRST